MGSERNAQDGVELLTRQAVGSQPCLAGARGWSRSDRSGWSETTCTRANVDAALDFHTDATGTDFALFIFADLRNPDSRSLAEFSPVAQIKERSMLFGNARGRLCRGWHPGDHAGGRRRPHLRPSQDTGGRRGCRQRPRAMGWSALKAPSWFPAFNAGQLAVGLLSRGGCRRARQLTTASRCR